MNPRPCYFDAPASTAGIRARRGIFCCSTSPLRAVAILPRSDFHEFPRAAGPKRQVSDNRTNQEFEDRQAVTNESRAIEEANDERMKIKGRILIRTLWSVLASIEIARVADSLAKVQLGARLLRPEFVSGRGWPKICKDLGTPCLKLHPSIDHKLP